MVSTNDDGWTPYIVFSREDLTLSCFFSRGLADPIRAATDTDVAHALVAGLVITRDFGPGAVHGKRAHTVGQVTIAVGGGRKYTGVERDLESSLLLCMHSGCFWDDKKHVVFDTNLLGTSRAHKSPTLFFAVMPSFLVKIPFFPGKDTTKNVCAAASDSFSRI